MVDKNLKIFLKKTKKTQKQVANDTGVHLKSVGNYITGNASPSSQFLKKLHEKYNLNINWLLSGKGEMLNHSTVVSYASADKIMGIAEHSITYMNMTPDEKELAAEIIAVIRRRNSMKKVIESLIEVGKYERLDDRS